MTTNTHVSAQTSAELAQRSPARSIAREVTLILAGAAAIALIGQIKFPLPFTPVPVSLGTLAALGVGGVLGGRRGLASVAVFALAGALGAPVFAGWNSGVTATFGYVIGYGLAAVIAAHATRTPLLAESASGTLRRLARRLLLMLAASVAVYVPGVAWLAVATGMDLATALAVGAVPFLVGDAVKSLAAAFVPRARR